MKHPLEDHFVFQIEFLSKVVDEAYSDLFSVGFQTFSGFDDIYSCDNCTNTNLCYVCAEFHVALQGDSINEVIYVAEALDIQAAPNILPIEKPSSLEPKPLPEDLYYHQSFNLSRNIKRELDGPWLTLVILAHLYVCI